MQGRKNGDWNGYGSSVRNRTCIRPTDLHRAERATGTHHLDHGMSMQSDQMSPIKQEWLLLVSDFISSLLAPLAAWLSKL